MVINKIKVICSVIIVIISQGFVLASKNFPSDSIKIKNLPEKCTWVNNPKLFSIDVSGDLSITAAKGTDIYHYSGGGFDISNAPLLTFNTDTNFVFTTKVSVKLNNQYDGGFLILFADTIHYAKVLIEKNHQDKIILCSCVTNRFSDDNVHFELSKSEAFIRISKIGSMYGFYYSEDGENWNYLRFFRFENNEKPVKLGMGVQSPYSNQCTSKFSNISYLPKALKNEMTGE